MKTHPFYCTSLSYVVMVHVMWRTWCVVSGDMECVNIKSIHERVHIQWKTAAWQSERECNSGRSPATSRCSAHQLDEGVNRLPSILLSAGAAASEAAAAEEEAASELLLLLLSTATLVSCSDLCGRRFWLKWRTKKLPAARAGPFAER